MLVDLVLFGAASIALVGAYLAVRAIRSLRMGEAEYRGAKDVVRAIVDSLTLRFSDTEQVLDSLQQTTTNLDVKQAALIRRVQSDSEFLNRVTEYVEEALQNDRRLARRLLVLQEKFDSVRSLARAVETDKASAPSIGVPFEVERPLSAILGPTENNVLRLLGEEGPLTAPEIGRKIGRTREHTARMMKVLFEQGFIIRESNRIPYRYRMNEKIREQLESRIKSTKDSGQADAASQQTETKSA